MNKKVIIFDFDGTLGDTFNAIVKITNRLAVEFGYSPTTSEELAQIRNLTSRQIIKQSGVSIFKLPFLLKRLKKDLRHDIEDLKPISGIKEALIQLKEQNNTLGILTSNSEENVRLFLKKQAMEELFSFICSGTTLFGKHKVLMKLMKQNHLTSEDVIYVGDETRDIEASKKINIKVIAVTWGFNSSEVLAANNPDFLIHHPRELIEVIENLQLAPQ